MTLQTSGAISFSDLQTEFGGSNPISLSEYYAGGAYVPGGTTGTNGAVPSSGTISMSQFYGTSNVVVTIADQFITATRVGASVTATALYGLDATGTAYKGVNGNTTFFSNWISPTSVASNYEVYATLSSGSLSTGTTGSWLALSSSRTWGVNRSAYGQSDAVIVLQIRKIGTTTVLDTATITFEVIREP